MRLSNKVGSPRISAIIISLSVLLAVAMSTPGFAQAVAPQPQKPKHVHVYLLRGLFNVFSTGMDGIRDKLKARNITATVHTHMVWRWLADEAVDDYRKGRIDTIIIMGHSAGATNAVDMANKIGEAGVPVSLVVALDPSLRATVTSSNVRWVVNLFLPSGMYGLKVDKSPDYSGVVENIGLTGDVIDHVTMDKTNAVQDRAIDYALKALNGGPRQARKRPANAANPANPRQAAAPR